MSANPGATSFRTACLWALLQICLVSPAHGQHASIAYETQSWSSAELKRFDGGLLRIDWDNGVEMFYDLGLARWSEEGTTCAGFVFAVGGGCAVEPIEVSSATLGMGAGVAVVDWTIAGGELVVVPFLGLAIATLEGRGMNTGGKNEDSLALLEAGLSARYRAPALWWDMVGPFVEARVSAGRAIYRGCDCSNTLQGDATRRSLLLGIIMGR